MPVCRNGYSGEALAWEWCRAGRATESLTPGNPNPEDILTINPAKELGAAQRVDGGGGAARLVLTGNLGVGDRGRRGTTCVLEI